MILDCKKPTKRNWVSDQTFNIHRQLTNFNFAAAAAAADDDDDQVIFGSLYRKISLQIIICIVAYWFKQQDDPPSGGFDAMMLRMARDGHLKDLTSLQCFQVIKVTRFIQSSLWISMMHFWSCCFFSVGREPRNNALHCGFLSSAERHLGVGPSHAFAGLNQCHSITHPQK